MPNADRLREAREAARRRRLRWLERRGREEWITDPSDLEQLGLLGRWMVDRWPYNRRTSRSPVSHGRDDQTPG